MLSICIPIYNYDVSHLVSDLENQVTSNKIEAEILLLDDNSTLFFHQKNKHLTSSITDYERLERNIGRSKIRNLLAQKAKYKNLIFLDSDSGIHHSFSLSSYIESLTKSPIVYGGTKYTEHPPNQEATLRWVYGINRESSTAIERKKTPFLSFKTNNFACRKEIFKEIQFNESLTEYGHEDTLFALEAQSKGINIKHIDSPVYHLGLETSSVFIQKTEIALSNLIKINDSFPNKNLEAIRVLKAYLTIKKYKLRRVFKMSFSIISPLIKSNLKSSSPSLFLFDIYKLGVLCSIRN